jgi:hypothetical protein
MIFHANEPPVNSKADGAQFSKENYNMCVTLTYCRLPRRHALEEQEAAPVFKSNIPDTIHL